MSNIKDCHELKRLQSQRDKLNVEIEHPTDDKKSIDNQLSTKHGKLNSINQQLKKHEQKNEKPQITEHAILRYFERVLGYNSTDVQNTILNETRCNQIKAIGSGKIPLIDGKHMVVKNKKVITIE